MGNTVRDLEISARGYTCVMNRVWIVEFKDNYASKNREEIRTEY